MFPETRDSPVPQTHHLLPCMALSTVKTTGEMMTTLRFFLAHYIKVKKIKLAVEGRCEVCRKECALDDLVIHTFINEDEAEKHLLEDLEEFLLVLCSRCHGDIHEFDAPLEEQGAVVRRRPEKIRTQIRKILAYAPKTVQPPDSDLEDAYREACSSRFRYGA